MPPQPQSDRRLAYLLLRLALGINICMHGVVRFPNIAGFADALVKQFAATPLPAFLVRPFAIGLTIEETLVGFLLLIGLWTREALIIGSLALCALQFGAVLLADWPIVAIQLFYSVVFAGLLAAREYNHLSMDVLMHR
jgi:thiosulfate dehydrogenase [quinone] large subunit